MFNCLFLYSYLKYELYLICWSQFAVYLPLYIYLFHISSIMMVVKEVIVFVFLVVLNDFNYLVAQEDVFYFITELFCTVGERNIIFR